MAIYQQLRQDGHRFPKLPQVRLRSPLQALQTGTQFQC
jgi:hypothetical protein